VNFTQALQIAQVIALNYNLSTCYLIFVITLRLSLFLHEIVDSVDIYEINSGTNLLYKKTKAIEYLILSKLLLTALVALLNLTNPSLKEEREDSLGLTNLTTV